MEKVLFVEGMTCKHCKMRVEKALNDLSGVKKVSIDLETGKTIVEIKKDIESQILVNAVQEAGYRVAKVE